MSCILLKHMLKCISAKFVLGVVVFQIQNSDTKISTFTENVYRLFKYRISVSLITNNQYSYWP